MLFYNGEKLWEGDYWLGRPLIYDEDENDSWEVIIVLPGVEILPELTFTECKNVEKVIMADTVVSIELEIEDWAFQYCKKLIIFTIPQNVQLGNLVFDNTALMKKSPIGTDEDGEYDKDNEEEVVQWIKSINNDKIHALHHACSSFNPLSEIIHSLVKRLGINAMRMKNSIGITPSQYLEANTFTDISEKEIVNRYILDSMGEIVLWR